VGAIDRRLVRLGRPARAHLAASVALGSLAAAATVAQATILAAVIDRVFRGGAGLSQVRGELVALAALAVCRAAAGSAADLSGRLAAGRLMSAVRVRLAEHVARNSFAVRRSSTGEVAAAAVQGVDGLETYFSRYLPQVVLSAVVPLIVLAYVALVDPIAAAVMAVTLPVLILFLGLVGSAARRRTAARWRALARLSGHFLDVVRGLPTLRAFDRAEAQTAVLAAVGERYRRETISTLRIAFLSAFVLELAAMLGTAMIAVTLGVRLDEGGIGLRAALTVLILAPELYMPLRQLGAQYHAAADGLAGVHRVLDILDRTDPVERPADPRPAPSPAEAPIRFERVAYSYPDGRGKAVDGIDLELRPGAWTSLVGPSGAGKSTLALLLLRLADPSSGRIVAGGVDLRRLDPDEWRASIAWVPQRPHVIAGSIAENVRAGRAGATDAQVRAAAAAAGIGTGPGFPDGLETAVGDGGRPLSGGEVRRLALARAFVREAHLLILDEPTAHLDAESAAGIAAVIADLARTHTTLLITHDRALAARGDTVVVLDGPGPPSQLTSDERQLAVERAA
jgi:thiol reductant ABC exporter CydD subunit